MIPGKPRLKAARSRAARCLSALLALVPCARAQTVSESAEQAGFQVIGSELITFLPRVALGPDWVVLGRWAVPFGSGGAVQLYRRGPDGQWAFDVELRPSDTQPQDSWGSQGLAVDGSFLAVAGNPTVVGGSVYVFRREGGAWVEEAKISDPTPNFGRWVELVGSDLLVGSAFAPGILRAYTRDPSGSWTPQVPLLGGRASGAALDRRTGLLATVSADPVIPEDTEVVLFERGPQHWVEVNRFPVDEPVGDIALGGKLIALTLPNRTVGVWRRQSGTWQPAGRIVSSGATDIAISEERVLLGNSFYESFVGEKSRGAIFVYAERDGAWELESRLRVEDRFANRSMGFYLSAHHGEVLASGSADAFLFRPVAVPGRNLVADEGVDGDLLPAPGLGFRYDDAETTGLGLSRAAVVTLPNQATPYQETLIDWFAGELCGNFPAAGWFEFRFDSRVEGPGGVEWVTVPGSGMSELSEHGNTPGDGTPRTHVYINRDCDVELAVRTTGAELAMDNFVQRPLRLPALGSFDVREAGSLARLGFVGEGEVFLFVSFVKRLTPFLFPPFLISGELWLGDDLRLIGQATGAGLGVPGSFQIALPADTAIIGVPHFLQALQVDPYSGRAPSIGSPVREVVLSPAGL